MEGLRGLGLNMCEFDWVATFYPSGENGRHFQASQKLQKWEEGKEAKFAKERKRVSEWVLCGLVLCEQTVQRGKEENGQTDIVQNVD